jgi:hypothetical protein
VCVCRALSAHTCLFGVEHIDKKDYANALPEIKAFLSQIEWQCPFTKKSFVTVSHLFS